MPRLFTGLQIPQSHADRLMLLRGDIAKARWIAPENYHITLRFLGDISDNTADMFIEKIAGLSFEPFTLSIKGVGHFGHRRSHALWAAVERNEQLDRLHKIHERAAIEAGLAAETRRFTPHITLARLSRTRPCAVAPFLADFADFKLPPFEVSEAVLFSAKPSTGGGPYVVEQVFAFLN